MFAVEPVCHPQRIRPGQDQREEAISKRSALKVSFCGARPKETSGSDSSNSADFDGESEMGTPKRNDRLGFYLGYFNLLSVAFRFVCDWVFVEFDLAADGHLTIDEATLLATRWRHPSSDYFHRPWRSHSIWNLRA
jgi:hypothetical protein